MTHLSRLTSAPLPPARRPPLCPHCRPSKWRPVLKRCSTQTQTQNSTNIAIELPPPFLPTYLTFPAFVPPLAEYQDLPNTSQYLWHVNQIFRPGARSPSSPRPLLHLSHSGRSNKSQSHCWWARGPFHVLIRIRRLGCFIKVFDKYVSRMWRRT